MRASSRGKNNGPVKCVNTQLSLFNRSVIAHAAADDSALCANTLAESKRRMMQTRQIRGLEIASRPKRPITNNGTFWAVPSQTTSVTYAVTIDPPHCTCPDFKKSAIKCKHIFAAEYHVTKESGETLPDVPEQKPKTYKQEWHEYNLAQTNEKAKFLELLYELCQNIEDLPKKPGAGRVRLPMRDMIFASVFKIYCTLSGRRFISDLREAFQRGYLSR